MSSPIGLHRSDGRVAVRDSAYYWNMGCGHSLRAKKSWSTSGRNMRNIAYCAEINVGHTPARIRIPLRRTWARPDMRVYEVASSFYCTANCASTSECTIIIMPRKCRDRLGINFTHNRSLNFRIELWHTSSALIGVHCKQNHDHHVNTDTFDQIEAHHRPKGWHISLNLAAC